MRPAKNRWGLFLLGASFAVGTILSGCAHVKPEEMETRLSDLRSELRTEIAEGDRENAEGLNARMNGLEGQIADLAVKLAALEEDLADLEREFGVEIRRLETALRFDMPVYFGFDEAELPAQALPILDRFAQVVMDYYPESLITAEGFTDPAGDPDYNLQLGKRRADAVREYLVDQRGLAGDHIRTVSYGEDTQRQVAGNSHGPGNEGWQNRRVALVIDHGGG
jgi:peptidoglycan-associated lipoprotein